MNIDDFENDYHIEKFKNRKKGVNGNRKGKRVERELVAVLNQRFGSGFSRSVGSGNRWGQVKGLPKHAIDSFTGDLVCPENFRFVCESKGGYNKIELSSAIDGAITDIDNFLEQVEDDSKRCNRPPLLFYKRDRKPWLVYCKTAVLEGEYIYSMKYRDYTCIPLREFLKLPDDYFFTK
jgi:hypothetical protein